MEKNNFVKKSKTKKLLKGSVVVLGLLAFFSLCVIFIGRDDPDRPKPVSRRYDVTLKYGVTSKKERQRVTKEDVEKFVEEVVSRSEGEIKFYGELSENKVAFLLSQDLAPVSNTDLSDVFRTDLVEGNASWRKVTYHPLEQEKLPEKKADTYICQYDSDCVVASSGCGCSAGGSVTAINWKYYNAYTRQPVGEMPDLKKSDGVTGLSGFACSAVMSKNPSCSKVPQCVAGRCMMVSEIVKETRIRF
ncbi:hypothetical protein H6758_03480 [Candidatus Nomurabacteria bacterium]|nr:hypothetical protein [Candidatus Nomurabacteria bacterium]